MAVLQTKIYSSFLASVSTNSSGKYLALKQLNAPNTVKKVSTAGENSMEVEFVDCETKNDELRRDENAVAHC